VELKDYQSKVIERLDRYLTILREKQIEAEEYAEFQRSKGRPVDARNFCVDAWDALNAQRLLPLFRDRHGVAHIAGYIDRRDGLNRPIPNICLKVPTAGGKTLLATAAIERINTDYFKQQTGFVLWVVPSDAIYRQTWKNLANREHPYRQMLERASGGRVKLFEKTDNFTKTDVEEFLCVMLVMLQASARESKEQLRMFRDSGRFTSFFPDVDNYTANNSLIQAVCNLDTSDLIDTRPGVLQGVAVKHSLGNTLRLVRPVIVIDEGHKAYSEIARSTLTGFNPRFTLELSATPNARERHSNVLVDVPGTALKDEQMIKLPIEIHIERNAGWKHTISAAHEKLAALGKAARKLHANDGRYIRPIMIVRVDRTGKDQRDGVHIHAEDAREYLTKHLGVKPEAIKCKTATTDELGDEDLLSEFSEVRYIITKDALREGWDCPFAYILTALSRTTAETAMTQMIGRILRQPETRSTSVPEMNQCYVYCFDVDVKDAVENVRRGLEEEGMGDLAEDVRLITNGRVETIKTETVKRADKFKKLKIFLPRVLHKTGKEFRPLDYHRDVLGALNWEKFSYTDRENFAPDDRDRLESTILRITMAQEDGQLKLPVLDQTTEEEPEGGDIDFPFMVRQLMEIVPNPWQAARIIDEALATLAARGIGEDRIFANRLFLLKEMKRDLHAQVHAASESIFRKKLATGDITFRLVTAGDDALNWALAETLEISVRDTDRRLRRQNDEPLERYLFERVYEKDFNGFERDVAWYLDETDAVAWWHRLVVRQDYNLQGWQKNKIYPDFLACLRENDKGGMTFSVLETKGNHLKGNDDTAYKQKLFSVLEEAYDKSLDAGEITIGDTNAGPMTFKIVMEESWRNDVTSIVAAATTPKSPKRVTHK
jgi:type III restriction enzyme